MGSTKTTINMLLIGQKKKKLPFLGMRMGSVGRREQ
jgi:hypothetical protein